MQPFITFREPLPSGEMGYFILQRAWPHYVGRIITDTSESRIDAAPVPHHLLFVTFAGTLNGNLIPAQPQALQELNAILHHMAAWFDEQRISPNPKKYAKWHFSPQ